MRCLLLTIDDFKSEPNLIKFIEKFGCHKKLAIYKFNPNTCYKWHIDHQGRKCCINMLIDGYDSLTMFGSIGGGYFPTYFINKGFKPYDGRMKAMLLIALFPLVVLLAQPLGHITFWIPVILIGIGASAHQAWSANIFTTVSDMFPKKAIGSIIGIGGMAGGFGGVLVSKMGGYLFDYYDSLGEIQTGYTIMFVVCAVAYLIAWSVMKLLVPKYSPINDL
jgi:ACS family hexuronate transporter-like MFS transporter